jgi:hypothetical protein
MYEKYLVEGKTTGLEATMEKMIAKTAKIPVKKVTKKLKVVFQLKQGLDEQEFDNFGKIDKIIETLEKMYPNAIIKHDWDKFIVEEL